MIKVPTVNILGVPIAAINLDQAASRIEAWIETGERNYVTVTGVHGVMESQDDPEVMRIHTDAGMCVPDGMPAVWIGRMLGCKKMNRVYGPDLMLEMMKRSVTKGYTHFFYGGKEGVPELLKYRLEQKFQGLRILGTLSPPFRQMTEAEDKELVQLINRLAPDIIWVGLSTPKQERWMADHVDRLNARVMIGVGAAFDFHAGLLKQAPTWIQKMGLEWFYRVCMEPRRLAKRYLKNNPRFVYMVLKQMLTPPNSLLT
jgi:N-acetylglucosaminyldiphosphoundecaprenol N-acetyl-beta-D-mannosaminyltransferase